MQENLKKTERVIAYVDGFNLYFGIRDAGFHKFRWLDVIQLSTKWKMGTLCYKKSQKLGTLCNKKM